MKNVSAQDFPVHLQDNINELIVIAKGTRLLLKHHGYQTKPLKLRGIESSNSYGLETGAPEIFCSGSVDGKFSIRINLRLITRSMFVLYSRTADGGWRYSDRENLHHDYVPDIIDVAKVIDKLVEYSKQCALPDKIRSVKPLDKTQLEPQEFAYVSGPRVTGQYRIGSGYARWSYGHVSFGSLLGVYGVNDDGTLHQNLTDPDAKPWGLFHCHTHDNNGQFLILTDCDHWFLAKTYGKGNKKYRITDKGVDILSHKLNTADRALFTSVMERLL